MSALTLPGSIPGLLRRGSPVRTVKHAGTGLFRSDFAGVVFDLQSPVVDERSAPVDRRGPPGAVLASFPGGPPFWAATKYLALDLTDATGRAHAAWWMAGEVGAAWVLSCDGFRRWELHGGERPRHSLSRAWQGIGAEMRRMGMASSDWLDCPALDDLDPNDPRLLPDGSRFVDALALRRVCLHVAGVTP